MMLTKTSVVIAWLTLVSCSMADESNRLSQYPMTDSTVQQWKLPGKLKEISGLALSDDGRLFAVADEMAVVFEINYADGALIKSFAFDDPVVLGDFEGIAWLDGLIYLTTSDGILFSAPIGEDDEHVKSSFVDTKLGEQCEIEGLAAKPSTGNLFFACKSPAPGKNASHMQIFEWSTLANALVATIVYPLVNVERALHVDHFNPSGIVIDPDTGNFIIVASRQKSLLEIGADGSLVAARRLRLPSRHRQPEGIELASGGKLLIADEGGEKKARLAIYEPRQNEVIK